MASYSQVDAWSRRREAHVQRGQVTTSCLWNACRAMVLGLLLVAAGAAMAALGYYNQQPVRPAAFAPPSAASELPVRQRSDSAVGGPYRHLSYFGSVIMGIGGFIVVASCVMTFEVRDSASKIVPARFRSQPTTVTSSSPLAQRSSASQTLPWHLQLAAVVPLTRSVSAPCVRGPLPPLPPEQPASVAPADGRRKKSISGADAARGRPAAAVGRLFRKHSTSVLCALRAAATRTPAPTSAGDRLNYDNRLGRQGGNVATGLVDGSGAGQRCSPSGGYHTFNGHWPTSDRQLPAIGIKRCLSSDRRLSESVYRSVNARARRRDVFVHMEQSFGDEILTVSHVAPMEGVSLVEENEQKTTIPRHEDGIPHRSTRVQPCEAACVLMSPSKSAPEGVIVDGTGSVPDGSGAHYSHTNARCVSEPSALGEGVHSVPHHPAARVSPVAGTADRVPPVCPEGACLRSPPSLSCSERHVCLCHPELAPDAADPPVSRDSDATVSQSLSNRPDPDRSESDSERCSDDRRGTSVEPVGEARSPPEDPAGRNGESAAGSSEREAASGLTGLQSAGVSSVPAADPTPLCLPLYPETLRASTN